MLRVLALVFLLAACGGATEPEVGTLLVQNNSPQRTVVRVTESAEPLAEGRQLNTQPIPPLGTRTFVVDAGCRWFAAWMEDGTGGGAKQCITPGRQLIMNVGDP
jgi:hypothetical protein